MHTTILYTVDGFVFTLKGPYYPYHRNTTQCLLLVQCACQTCFDLPCVDYIVGSVWSVKLCDRFKQHYGLSSLCVCVLAVSSTLLCWNLLANFLFSLSLNVMTSTKGLWQQLTENRTVFLAEIYWGAYLSQNAVVTFGPYDFNGGTVR